MLKKILFAVVLLLLSGILIFQFAFVNVPIASVDIASGSLIKPSDIAMKRYFFSNVPAVALKSKDLISGKTATADIDAGSYFASFTISAELNNNTGSSVLDADHIMLSLNIDPKNVPTSISIGDTVKVVAYFSSSSSGAIQPFAVAFPYLAKVSSLKKDDSGRLTGVDVITNKIIGTELTVASLQGTIALIKVIDGAYIDTSGSTVDLIYSHYFNGSPLPTN